MPLNDTKLRAMKPGARTIKVSDGGGLHIVVSPRGSKLWRLAYRFGGRQKVLSFGDYPRTSLVSARKQREEAKLLLAGGVDPSQSRHQQKRERQGSQSNTFGALADEFLAKTEKEGRADVTLAKKKWLLGMARASFGRSPIVEVGAAEILSVLRDLESKDNLETARRLRAVIGQVYRYAIATNRAVNDPTYALRGAIAAPRVTHRAAMTDWTAFARLLRAVWSYQGQPETLIALKLMAILYPRPGELRAANWSEFDLKRRIWIIPAERTKMRRELRKPLPLPAMELLTELAQFTGGRQHAFASASSPKKKMSENTLNSALRRMGFKADEATSHGFRASASSLLNESGLWTPDAIEAELGHATGSAVRRAYHRASYWEERGRMSEWWANKVQQAASQFAPAEKSEAMRGGLAA